MLNLHPRVFFTITSRSKLTQGSSGKSLGLMMQDLQLLALPCLAVHCVHGSRPNLEKFQSHLGEAASRPSQCGYFGPLNLSDSPCMQTHASTKPELVRFSRRPLVHPHVSQVLSQASFHTISLYSCNNLVKHDPAFRNVQQFVKASSCYLGMALRF